MHVQLHRLLPASKGMQRRLISDRQLLTQNLVLSSQVVAHPFLGQMRAGGQGPIGRHQPAAAPARPAELPASCLACAICPGARCRPSLTISVVMWWPKHGMTVSGDAFNLLHHAHGPRWVDVSHCAASVVLSPSGSACQAYHGAALGLPHGLSAQQQGLQAVGINK